MLASGNGTPQQCAANLMRMRRGESPLDRTRGIDATLCGKPIEEAADSLESDAIWVLETYEPRAQVEKVSVNGDPGNGDLTVDAVLAVNTADEEGADT